MADTDLQKYGVDKEFLLSLDNEVMDELGANDFILPRYRLIQNTSRTGTPGKWVSNLDPNKELDTLEIIILKITNFRTYFPPAGQGDKPLCRSNDGKQKASPELIGDGNCSKCRYSVWAPNPTTGKSDPPPCFNGYNIFGLIRLPDGTTEIGTVSFKRAAVKACKSYFTRMKGKGYAPFAYPTFITAVAEVNDKGRFFRPEFSMGELLTMEEILAAADLSKQYSDMFSNLDFVDDNDNSESGVSDFTRSLDDAISSGEGSLASDLDI